MIMFDNRLICFRNKTLLRYPPTRCSLNVDRSLINGLNIIMASYINAAKGQYNGFTKMERKIALNTRLKQRQNINKYFDVSL